MSLIMNHLRYQHRMFKILFINQKWERWGVVNSSFSLQDIIDKQVDRRKNASLSTLSPWYLLIRPDAPPGESSPWYASFWEFLRLYLHDLSVDARKLGPLGPR